MTPGMQKRSALYDAGGINPDEERIGTQTPNAKTPKRQTKTFKPFVSLFVNTVLTLPSN